MSSEMSLTMKGLLVLIIGLIAHLAGWVIPDSDIATTVDKLLSFVALGMDLIGLVMVYIGRVRKGDITWYGTRVAQLVPVPDPAREQIL